MKNDFETGSPKRQGFYEAKLKDGTVVIAEWREYDKKEGKRWWQHLSSDPTIAKEPQPLEGVVGWRSAEKAKVEAALKRELTHEEKIAESKSKYRTYRFVSEDKEPPVPENRLLAIGDEIEIGNLPDLRVVDVDRDGRVITCTFRNIKRERGENVDLGIGYSTWHWTSTIKKADVQPTKLGKYGALRNVNYLNSELDSLIHRMSYRDIEDHPDYQRGYVWTHEDKMSYLDSIFEGRELGRFIFVKYPYPRADELFDGKQRLSTVMDFFMSKLPYKGIYYHQMSRHDRHLFGSRSVQYAELNAESMTRADLLRIFLAVNAAGVPQTAEHLRHVEQLLAEEEAKEAAEQALNNQ